MSEFTDSVPQAGEPGKLRSRRAFCQHCLTGTLLTSMILAARAGQAVGADQSLLSPADPAAKKVKYVEDASKLKEAAGNKCSSCGLYQGTNNAAQGPCQIFPGKDVKAAGWCNAWAPQM